jgi:hypothetical protein
MAGVSLRATVKLALSPLSDEAVASLCPALLIMWSGCALSCCKFWLVPLTVALAFINETVPKESSGLKLPLGLLTISSTHSAEESVDAYVRTVL